MYLIFIKIDNICTKIFKNNWHIHVYYQLYYQPYQKMRYIRNDNRKVLGNRADYLFKIMILNRKRLGQQKHELILVVTKWKTLIKKYLIRKRDEFDCQHKFSVCGYIPRKPIQYNYPEYKSQEIIEAEYIQGQLEISRKKYFFEYSRLLQIQTNLNIIVAYCAFISKLVKEDKLVFDTSLRVYSFLLSRHNYLLMRRIVFQVLQRQVK